MNRPATGEDGNHVTFCRLCESFCGLVATVKGGRVVAVKPDQANPHSLGHVCIKGTSVASVTYDPDRLLYPMKRVGAAGEFERVGWDEALDDIAARLVDIRDTHGGAAIASYLGNPTGYSSAAFSSFGAFLSAMGSKKLYGAGSQDSSARLTAYFMIHGGPFYTTVPDLPDCDFLLMLGANPLVSNGWMIWNPRWRHDLDEIAARGRVLVVDPRKTETARRYEHCSIQADSDVWLLLGLLRVIFDENLLDRAKVTAICEGLDDLERWAMRVTLTDVALRTGLSVDAIIDLARAFATAPRAAIYGALGLCRGTFGTLGAYLSSVLNAVTGRYGAPGGLRFGRKLMAERGERRVGGHGERSTRIGNIPTIANKMATAMLPADIEEPGEGRVRALLCSAGNPVVTAPGGADLERALGKLELMVSFDIYMTESNRHAHYILPAVTFLERADWPMIGMNVALRPFLQFSPAVVRPLGEAREDYEIYHGIAVRMGIGEPTPAQDGKPARPGLPADPNRMIDAAVRRGPLGDQMGKRTEGWSRDKLLDNPHGVMVDFAPEDRAEWPDRIGYPDGKLRIWHPLADIEMERLLDIPLPNPDSLKLIGRRDIRSINSWMHNVDRLVRSQEATLLMHPRDATARDIRDGDSVSISSAHGVIRTKASISEDIRPGTVSYPHGWGHDAGWERSNATDGTNVNKLHGLGIDAVEKVSGMSLIDCLEVLVKAEPEPPVVAGTDATSGAVAT